MKQFKLQFFVALAAMVTTSFITVFGQVPQVSCDEAVKSLQAGLNDRKEMALLLDRLSTTEDISLLPVFTKLMRNEDDRVRLLATGLVSRLAGRQAVPLLRDRLFHDPAMRVRGEALSQLLKMSEL
ncbi:MAG TPA: HEAT repeat domain-containing protein, partial [Phycisphaerae bacterium]|nr:HEAT repeat domain-containing protein [Phycisphaerae bacterium]